MKCGICSCELDNFENLLSADCGGDCRGCIGEIEADMGDDHLQKYAKNLRKD